MRRILVIASAVVAILAPASCVVAPRPADAAPPPSGSACTCLEDLAAAREARSSPQRPTLGGLSGLISAGIAVAGKSTPALAFLFQVGHLVLSAASTRRRTTR